MMRKSLTSIITSNRGVILFLTIVLTSLVMNTYAQTFVNSSDESNVTVIKKQWRFQVRNPAMDESPFLDAEERFQQEQDWRKVTEENKRRVKLGLKPVKARPRPDVEKKDGPAAATYVYEVKLRNTGEKAISALFLEYIFFEPNTERELSRRRFLSFRDIAPGKSKTLVFRSVAPPTGTINAQNAGKKQGELYSEQVIIQGVKYTDGSVWQASKQL